MLIRKVDAYKNDLSRVIVYFEDKSYITVSVERARELNLKAGDEVDATLMQELSDSSRESAAKACAARIIGRSSMSCATLLKKLRDKGIDEISAQAALDWLCGLGIMDDTAYAKTLVAHYRTRGFGNRRILEEMRKRGITREVADTVLDDCDMNEEITEYILKKIRGAELDDKLKARITNALLRRGHSYDEIKRAFNRTENGGNGF
ncbi:MAG: regulatory protein RecX [Clostridia bacterium]|nr:regulatory protein RecX [Clostridia bacterium]